MTVPEWLPRAVFYQIFPASFCDTTGEGVGDLAGIEHRLDYLAQLGVNALLIRACYPSPLRNGGFDITDHQAIASRYGSLEDMTALIDAAHERDIRICIDLIPGHTSDQHPLFTEASASDSVRTAEHGSRTRVDDQVPALERYIWSADPRPLQDVGLAVAPGLGDRPGVFSYERYVHQPALNYGFGQAVFGQQSADAPGPAANWAALRKTMRCWLERGIDGFHVLAPHRLIKADPYFLETRRCWQSVNSWLAQDYPGAAMISNWGMPELATDAGFHLDLLLDPHVGGYSALFLSAETRPAAPETGYFAVAPAHVGGAGDFSGFWRSWAFQQARLAPGHCMGLPTSGPELQRLSRHRDEADLKLIFTFLLTWPTVPFIYYGDEIGMRFVPGLPNALPGFDGTHAFDGSRTPMQWDDTALAGFSAAAESAPWLPLDDAPERPTVAAQRRTRDSLWHHVERLIYLRATEQDLWPQAPVEVLGEPSQAPLVYRRGQGIVVAINPGRSVAQARLPQLGDVTPVLSHRCQLNHAGETWTLRLGARAFGVFNTR